MRVVSMNLRAYFGPGGSQIEDLAALISGHEPDVVLLQEMRPRWLEVVCRAAGLSGVHSLDVSPVLHAWRGDGCGVAVRPPLQIERAWRLDPGAFEPVTVASRIAEPVPVGFEVLPERLAARFSTRTLFAEVSGGERDFVAAALHATPGTGRVGGRIVSEWKPFFHGAAAISLAELGAPFVFAIDANEPRSETLDSVTFHWADGRPGSMKFAALLGMSPLHRARDLQRELMFRTGAAPAAPGYLELTYTTSGGKSTIGEGRRFDSIWATPEFTLKKMETFYTDALTAGADHALLCADLTL
jgi:Endonuclease/Exonuclease/phosphatase family